MKLRITVVLAQFFLASILAFSQRGAPQPIIPEKAMTTPEIPGVVAAGTKIDRVWTGNQSADGIAGAPDGSLLFTEQAANRVSKLDEKGRVSVVAEDANGPGALGIDQKGRVIGIERTNMQVEILAPTRKVLVDEPASTDLNDIVIDKKGGVYFNAQRKPPLKSAIYYIKPSGETVLASEDVARSNGLMLSPDEKVLYVTNTPEDYIVAFDVQPDASLTNMRNFGDKVGPGGDGLGIDAAGRLYINFPAAIGVMILSPEGKKLGNIPMPRGTTSLAFAGPGKKTLYIVGRGNDGLDGSGRYARTMYKISMLAEGFKGRAK